MLPEASTWTLLAAGKSIGEDSAKIENEDNGLDLQRMIAAVEQQ
jgi:hypothetical protein